MLVYTAAGFLLGALATAEILFVVFRLKQISLSRLLSSDINCEKLKVRIQKLELIFNNLPDGLVAVNNSLKTLIVNPFARTVFNFGNEDIANRDIYDIVKDESICSLIEKTINEDCSFSEEFSLDHPSRILKITTNPIKSNQDILGAILLIQDITEVKDLQQMGSEFVSNVTHELKTPLTSIRGFIETLKSGAINDPKVAHRFLDIIDIEAERLYLLINDILALSEIETMRHDIDMVSVSIEKVVAASIEVLQGQAERKKISVTTNIEPGLEIKANKHRIMQLVMNLIDNSIKYSPKGSWIMIEACEKGDSVLMSFKDSGIGIPSQHLSRIFERFYRVDKSRSRSLGGTGLGLSIVKHIVEMYNGDIEVFSEPDKGTEFIIALPAQIKTEN